jgi:hypothetical protein
MDLDKALSEVINEDVGSIWNNNRYGAASEEPRKDFVGFSTRDGYNFPYQHNAPPVFPPTEPQPEQTPDLPWPLATVGDDLADSFVYMTAAVQKIITCLDQNPSLSRTQKAQISEISEKAKRTLAEIELIGVELLQVAQLAGPLPPQSAGQQ